MEKYCRDREIEKTDENVIRRRRIACWITTNTLRKYNTYFCSTTTMVVRTRVNITLYYIGCPVKLQLYRYNLTEYSSAFCVLQTAVVYTKDY